MDKIPDGPVDVKVNGFPDGEYFSRVEQPRGEVIHYVKGNGGVCVYEGQVIRIVSRRSI